MLIELAELRLHHRSGSTPIRASQHRHAHARRDRALGFMIDNLEKQAISQRHARAHILARLATRRRRAMS
ncbi:hypothetical protein ACFSQT_32335 [Mesorhizobium calcicola]|uniref:Uncharacterized protein n=1 Tax=Mesorhizobium calcicola TaxID=1300310 RepID=A0ABW4WM77_9HYPH